MSTIAPPRVFVDKWVAKRRVSIAGGMLPRIHKVGSDPKLLATSEEMGKWSDQKLGTCSGAKPFASHSSTFGEANAGA